MDAQVTTYQVMPPLSGEDYASLKADIEARGVLVPVEYDEVGNILDGHHRVKICRELGIDWPRLIREGFSEDEKWTHARQLNIARRHLNQEQKRALIADQLRQTPHFSNNRIAEGLGVSDHTVAAVRDELVKGSQIANVSTVTSKDGQPQPARKPKLTKIKLVDNSEAAKAGAKERAKEIGAPVRGTAGTGENEWYTPPEYIALARSVMGGIDLDPASSEHANEAVQAERFYSKEDDALTLDWHGRVWLNPPYAQPLIAHFADKMAEQVRAGNVTEAIMLTHNYTDTTWFQKLATVASAMCFTRGRVKFYSPDGEIAAPTQGQAFFYFAKDATRFFEHFRDVGFVVEVRHE